MTINMLKTLKRLLVVATIAPAFALAGDLDRAPLSTSDESLQSGAKLFVNYCMGCHSASLVRYNQLEDLGLTEDEVLDNLHFTGDRVGDLMKVNMRPEHAEKWFGTSAPDLSLITRQRAGHTTSGADWLYTYMRQFYRDPDQPNGWNNLLFENVGMPHVLWELQGDQVPVYDDDGNVVELELVREGTMSPEEYDQAMADLTSFLHWTTEPVGERRRTIGIFVLLFLAGFSVLAYALKKNYWKDIH